MLRVKINYRECCYVGSVDDRKSGTGKNSTLISITMSAELPHEKSLLAEASEVV